ncbi:MAG TPA: hypothetical protein V6C84_28485 [Coleofasciculaceae cyanobacterium]
MPQALVTTDQAYPAPKIIAWVRGEPIFSLEWVILSQDPRAFKEVTGTPSSRPMTTPEAV